MKLPKWKKSTGRSCTVQTAGAAAFREWPDGIPLAGMEAGLYDAMRRGIPIIDAALDKTVRLVGGFRVECANPRYQAELEEFMRDVRVGATGQGLHQFTATYLDSLLLYGNAVGEMVPEPDGGGLYALYNAPLGDVRVRQGKNPLDITFCARDTDGSYHPVRYQDLILFTPLMPPAGQVMGQSLLRSLPFVSGILLKIFHSTGTNFERIANLRYAVTYRPGNSGLDKAWAKDIAEGIAAQWGDAMEAAKSGVVKDFVAVGDVDIKVIGADNQMIDTEVPVRQMLEQIVAKLGIPPFMLGLHWSSTERMSTQQADILTSELESYRTLLTPVICRICDFWLLLRGYGCRSRVVWDDINLQDEVEAANARLLQAQAEQLERRGKG